MVKKSGPTTKPEPSKKSTTTSTITTPVPQQQAEPEKPTASVTPTLPTLVSNPDPVTTAPTTEQEKSVSEVLLTGPELEKSIDNIVDMGFPRDQVILAMRASFNNPARAVDYLTNGIPPEVTSLAQPPPARQQQTAPPPRTAPTTSPLPSQRPPQTKPPIQSSTPSPVTPPSHPTTPQSVSHVFDGLRQHPQFHQLCALAQQGGEDALKQILTYFAQTNRPLLDLIMQNQEEFIRLLSTPVSGSAPPQGGPGGAPPPNSPGVIRLHVTPEDERVINNLVAMGFDRNRVLEAYFLFEKDETMTANYLLNNPDFN